MARFGFGFNKNPASPATSFLLTSIGNGTGVSTLEMTVNKNMTLTLDGSAKFYTDAAGTEGESSTWAITTGASRKIYLKCTSGTARLRIPNRSYITKWGTPDVSGWTSVANAARITGTIGQLEALTLLNITGTSTFTGALPTGLTYMRLWGNGIAWTFTGALPTGLTYLYLWGNGIAWTYNGALPTGITALNLQSDGIAWTYNGALPTGITQLYLISANIAWTYNGALPTGITTLYVSSANIDWTGLDVTGTGNIGNFSLLDYRIGKMSSDDMVTLLTSMTDRAGNLPATVTINDYADYASPPQAVTDAVTTLKTTKSITTVNLGA